MCDVYIIVYFMYVIVYLQFFFILFYIYLFFFFKQKTAYEMRISDWSSDVCSSDLKIHGHIPVNNTAAGTKAAGMASGDFLEIYGSDAPLIKIGRASCRERVCKYV